MTIDTKALRRDLSDFMDRLCDTATDDEFDWITDHIEKPTQRLICERDGHIVVDDMCKRPDHRFCITCHEPMPGVPLTSDRAGAVDNEGRGDVADVRGLRTRNSS